MGGLSHRSPIYSRATLAPIGNQTSVAGSGKLPRERTTGRLPIMKLSFVRVRAMTSDFEARARMTLGEWRDSAPTRAF